MIVWLVALLSGINLLKFQRGLDVTDELYYLVEAIDPSSPWGSRFGVVTSIILKAAGGELWMFRLAGYITISLALTYFNALLLSDRQRTRCVNLSRSIRILRFLWVAASPLAALLFYSGFLRTPGYNWLAAVGIMLSTPSVKKHSRETVTKLGRAISRSLVGSQMLLISLGLFFLHIAKPYLGLAASVIVLAFSLQRRILLAPPVMFMALLVCLDLLGTNLGFTSLTNLMSGTSLRPGGVVASMTTELWGEVTSTVRKHFLLTLVPTLAISVKIVGSFPRGRLRSEICGVSKRKIQTSLLVIHGFLVALLNFITSPDLPPSPKSRFSWPFIGMACLTTLVMASIARKSVDEGCALNLSCPNSGLNEEVGRITLKNSLKSNLTRLGLISYPLLVSILFAIGSYNNIFGQLGILAALLLGLSVYVADSKAASFVSLVVLSSLIVADPVLGQRQPYRIAPVEKQAVLVELPSGLGRLYVDTLTAEILGREYPHYSGDTKDLAILIYRWSSVGRLNSSGLGNVPPMPTLYGYPGSVPILFEYFAVSEHRCPKTLIAEFPIADLPIGDVGTRSAADEISTLELVNRMYRACEVSVLVRRAEDSLFRRWTFTTQ